LSLVLCGSSPSNIGSLIWKEHPTLRSLIKMTTAVRYRFPTVDCDEAARDEMKKSEQAARDEVRFIFDGYNKPLRLPTKVDHTLYGCSGRR
jgi:hypothetical protein